MKLVYSAQNEVDAQLVKGFLDDQGIEAVVQSEALSTILGAIPANPDTLPSIWVRDEDLDVATNAIAGFKTEPHPAHPTAGLWTCTGCGQQIEPQFTECWNCGATKPQLQ